MSFTSFLDMEPLFIFLRPSFLLEHGPGRLYLSILVMGGVPCYARMYVGAQLWSILLPLMHKGPAFCVRVPHATRITRVTGGEGGVYE